MNKKIALVLLLVVVSAYVFAVEQNIFGQSTKEPPKKRYFSFGAGLGIPYGIIGFMVEIDPVPYVGLTAGLGFAVEGLGYAVGMRIMPLGNKSFTPLLSGYYGTVAFVLGGGETVPGGAIGGGGRFMIHTRNVSFSITGELLYTFWDTGKWGEGEGSPIKLSLGGQLHF